GDMQSGRHEAQTQRRQPPASLSSLSLRSSYDLMLDTPRLLKVIERSCCGVGGQIKESRNLLRREEWSCVDHGEQRLLAMAQPDSQPGRGMLAARFLLCGTL